MHNELFSIGPFTVYGYGLMIAIGLFSAYCTADYRAKKLNCNADRVYSIFIFGAVFGMLGAKLMYLLTIIPQIIKDPSLLYRDFLDGFVVYGGIILGILSAVIYLKVKKEPILTYLDICVPSISLGQGFGRIGCFLAGCCYGHESHGWYAVTFHSSQYAPNNIPLFPTQIISSVFDFALYLTLTIFLRKRKTPGTVLSMYLILYSIGRFTIEFFRGDLERGAVGILSTSQFISVFIFLAGIISLIAFKKKQVGKHSYP